MSLTCHVKQDHWNARHLAWASNTFSLTVVFKLKLTTTVTKKLGGKKQVWSISREADATECNRILILEKICWLIHKAKALCLPSPSKSNCCFCADGEHQLSYSAQKPVLQKESQDGNLTIWKSHRVHLTEPFIVLFQHSSFLIFTSNKTSAWNTRGRKSLVPLPFLLMLHLSLYGDL